MFLEAFRAECRRWYSATYVIVWCWTLSNIRVNRVQLKLASHVTSAERPGFNNYVLKNEWVGGFHSVGRRGYADQCRRCEQLCNSHEEQIKAAGEVRMERRHRARM